MRTSALLLVVSCLVPVAWGEVRVTNVDQDTRLGLGIPAWSICIKGGTPPFPDCNPGGAGIPQGATITYGQASPARDGNSVKLSLTSAVGGNTNGLFPYKAGADDLTAVFVSDFYFYPSANSASASQFEFDSFLFSKSENTEFMFGTQCNQTSGKWQIFDQLNGNWIDISPTLACSVTPATWHHVQWTMHRIPGDRTGCSGQPCMYYDRLTFDDVPHDINMKEPAGILPVGWTSAVGFQFQINIPGGNNTVSMNVDLANFSALQSLNQCP